MSKATLATPVKHGLSEEEVLARLAVTVKLGSDPRRALEQAMQTKYRVLMMESYGVVAPHAAPFDEILICNASAEHEIRALSKHWSQLTGASQDVIVRQSANNRQEKNVAWFGYGVCAADPLTPDIQICVTLPRLGRSSEESLEVFALSERSTGMLITADEALSPHNFQLKDNKESRFSALREYGLFIGRVPGPHGFDKARELSAMLLKRAGGTWKLVHCSPLELDGQPIDLPAGDAGILKIALKPLDGLILQDFAVSRAMNFSSGYAIAGMVWPSATPGFSAFASHVSASFLPFTTSGALAATECQSLHEEIRIETGKNGSARLPGGDMLHWAFIQAGGATHLLWKRQMRGSPNGKTDFGGFMPTRAGTPNSQNLQRLSQRIACEVTSVLGRKALIPFQAAENQEVQAEEELKVFFRDLDASAGDRLSLDRIRIEHGLILIRRGA